LRREDERKKRRGDKQLEIEKVGNRRMKGREEKYPKTEDYRIRESKKSRQRREAEGNKMRKEKEKEKL
jgi:hypothetical protein